MDIPDFDVTPEALKELREQATDALADRAERWQGDGPNDRLARGIIASVRVVIDSMSFDPEEEEAPDMRLVFAIVQQFAAIMPNLTLLDGIANARDASE